MTVTFRAPSGAPSFPTVMANLDLNIGNTSGLCFLGMFGLGGPESSSRAILTNSYNSSTYMTNSAGEDMSQSPYGVTASGKLHNAKFIDVSTAQINQNPQVLVSVVPESSGTILIRFQPTGTFQTQNAVLRCVNLNASSGVTDETALISNINAYAFEAGHDSAWTAVGANGLVNYLSFDDRAANTVHDFHPCISVSPLVAGVRNDFAWLYITEFL